VTIMDYVRTSARRFFAKTFSFWEKQGFHVMPTCFTEPIPDTTKLKDDLWSKHSEMVGIDINERGSLNLLRLFSSSYKNEYDALSKTKTSIPYEFYVFNGVFETVDAEIMWCMIRHLKPRRILEIGSGYSTMLAAHAVLANRKDGGRECDLTVIDPYPGDIVSAGFPGLSRVIRKGVEEVPLTAFSDLRENDILFIDSSHVVKIGSDVQYLYLEVLPRLNKGVVVHAHDIFLPAEYPREWVKRCHRFWNEQYVLQAFLAFNREFEVIWAGRHIHLNHQDELEKAFGSCKKDGISTPGSFWFKRVR